MEHIHDGPMAGRTVPVTGATSGIGHATALRLAWLGAHVAITGRDRNRTREITAAAGVVVDVFDADLWPVMKSPAEGAATPIHLASAPDLEPVSGRYFAGRRPRSTSTPSYDQRVAARLWEASADLVGPTAAPHV